MYVVVIFCSSIVRLTKSGQFLGYATIEFGERSEPFIEIYMLLWSWYVEKKTN